jgi:putative transposase
MWTYDFVHNQLANCGPLKMLFVLDENMCESLAIEVGKSLRSQDVILTLSRLCIYGKPAFIRSDNSPEFAATGRHEMAARPEHRACLHQAS